LKSEKKKETKKQVGSRTEKIGNQNTRGALTTA